MFRKLRAAIQLLRPAQWVKNVFVFGAFVFGANPEDPEAFLQAFIIVALSTQLSATSARVLRRMGIALQAAPESAVIHSPDTGSHRSRGDSAAHPTKVGPSPSAVH